MGLVEQSNGNMLGGGYQSHRYAQQMGLPNLRAQQLHWEQHRTHHSSTASERMIQGMSVAGQDARLDAIRIKPAPTASERMIQGMSKAGTDAEIARSGDLQRQAKAAQLRMRGFPGWMGGCRLR